MKIRNLDESLIASPVTLTLTWYLSARSVFLTTLAVFFLRGTHPNIGLSFPEAFVVLVSKKKLLAIVTLQRLPYSPAVGMIFNTARSINTLTAL